MPLQNRVTPYGDIVAISQRGLFTGNRGIIHDPLTKTLLRKRWTTHSWLICSCDYKGRRRDVMARRSWTELFFLDEALALAAGHRPCFLCRREAAERFRASWASAVANSAPSAKEMDAVLHGERQERGRKRLHPVPRPLAGLPDGVMLEAGGHAYILRAGLAQRWTETGYEKADVLREAEWLITPPSTLNALAKGYRPVFHPSINMPLNRPENVRFA